MKNQENRFAKTSSKAIKSLVSRAVPGNTKKKNTHTQNMPSMSLKVWPSLHKFRSQWIRAEGYILYKSLPGLLVYQRIKCPRVFTDLLSNSPKRLSRFSPGYEGTEIMFYFFYKIIIFHLNKKKDGIRSTYVYFNFFMKL